MPAPRSLNANIIYLCSELSHMVHRALTVSFAGKKINVTVEQFAVLVLLFYHDGINQQEISESLNRNKTTVARVISNMERNKLIIRVTDKTDARGKLIYLTTKGKAIQRQGIELSGAIYLKAISGIKNIALKESVSVLNNILQNLK
jgi:MarR family transcriptional regulator, organic hydroperoxide resistance regulator